MNDDDMFRRDVLDLEAHRRRVEDGERLIGLCCLHCRGAAHDLPGPGGSYLDLYIRSGLPTKAIAFAAIAWGLLQLVMVARYVFVWATEIYELLGPIGPRQVGGLF